MKTIVQITIFQLSSIFDGANKHSTYWITLKNENKIIKEYLNPSFTLSLFRIYIKIVVATITVLVNIIFCKLNDDTIAPITTFSSRIREPIYISMFFIYSCFVIN